MLLQKLTITETSDIWIANPQMDRLHTIQKANQYFKNLAGDLEKIGQLFKEIHVNQRKAPVGKFSQF